jgi:general nucleoside transport system permease protein
MTASSKPASRPTPTALLRRLWSMIALPLVSIVLALVVGAILILASELLIPNHQFDPALPLIAYQSLFVGAIGSVDAILTTLVFTTPLILAGLAVGLGFRGGLFNIGVLGQFLIGALFACWVGIQLREAPALIAWPSAVVAGIIGGALWGFIPGFLKARAGAHEVVTTIMLNYIAIDVLAAVVSGPLKAPGSQNPVTQDVGNAALPILIEPNLHLGFLLAVVATILYGWLLFRTTTGFEIRTTGASPDAARYAGMKPARLIMLTMALSGALAGLAGAGQVLGVNGQLNAAYSTTVGFDGIAVALLGRSSPIGIVAASLLFGGMRAGAGLMQINARIPTELVDVLQATILLFLVASPVLRRVFRLRGARGIESAQTITASYAAPGTATAPTEAAAK